MTIRIIGGTKNQKKYTRSMVKFCIKTLMPRMTTLDITIKLKRPNGALGYCLELDDKRTFEIEADRTQRMRRLLETIAHEMVHVKQYARRELHPVQNVTSTFPNEIKTTDYWDLPWEIEAHGREVGLFVRWCEKNNLGDKKWTQDV